MQAAGVKLSGQCGVERFGPAAEIGGFALVAIGGANQGYAGEQGIGRISGERRAELEALHLGAEDALDGTGLFGGGVFEQQREVPQPIQHALGSKPDSPTGTVELAFAADPVQHQGAGEATGCGVTHIAEVAEPGEAVEVLPPVGVGVVEAEGGGPAGFDELVGEQVAAGHHVADGFAVRWPNLGDLAGKGVVTEAAPGPAHQRPGHHGIGCAECGAAQAVGQGRCHHTRSRLGMQIAKAALPPIVTLFTLVRLSAPAR